VAAPFLRPLSAGFILSLCKNGDATRGARIYAWWITPRACRLRSARDTTSGRVMGGPWAKQKRTRERTTANVLRARIAEQRSYVGDHVTNDLAVIARSRPSASTARRTSGCAFRSAPQQIASRLTMSARFPQPFR